MEISGNKLTLTADPFGNSNGQQIVSIRTFERADLSNSEIAIGRRVMPAYRFTPKSLSAYPLKHSGQYESATSTTLCQPYCALRGRKPSPHGRSA
jgi:hypothetical protein